MQHLRLLVKSSQKPQGTCVLLQHIAGMRPESHDHALIPTCRSSLHKLLYNKTVPKMDTVKKAGGYNHLTSSKSCL